MPSIFSRIIAGEIPAAIVYQDDYTVAFLDRSPITPGHTLVIPRCEVDHLYDVPEPYYSAIFRTAKLLSPALLLATGAQRIASMVQGFDVPHAHYHLIPASSGEALHHPSHDATPEELTAMQERIRAALETS
ncbi:HIT family protein [Candidatus Peribacteria bacterium]|nr:HIT family protein [Candidatus Peribacteria bacterium]